MHDHTLRFWITGAFFCAALVAGPFSLELQAEEGLADSTKESRTIHYGSELDFNSRYVWHGLAWSEGAVVQPSAWVSAFNFTFSVWNNFVLGNEANQGQFNEVDLTLAYDWAWRKLGAKPALQLWLYPNQPGVPATGQASMELSYPVGPFRFFTSHALDISAYPGAYYGDFGLSFERELSPNLSMSTSLGLAFASSKYNDAYVGLKQTAFAAAGGERGQLSFTYYPKEFLYLRPHLSYSCLLDRRLRTLVEHANLFTFGLVTGVEF